MGNVYEKIKELPPKTKRTLILLSTIAVVLVGSLILYAGKTDNNADIHLQKKKVELKEITIAPDLIEKTALREQRAKNRNLEEKYTALLERVNELEAREPGEEFEIYQDPTVMDIPIPDAESVMRYSSGHPFPSYPPSPESGRDYLPPNNPVPEKRIIGGISVISNPEASLETDTVDPADKKKKSYYLPPSFMKAGLLTGFNALTSGRGHGNTEPVLIRIQAPAVLPNDVKARLQGCFIVAEAFGDLAKERADIRLITLSCISKEGEAVIDSKIKGFVTDEDGKVGLSGRVVSKMGASIARSFVAGVFKGIGDGLSSSSLTTSTSGLTGVTTGVINTDDDTITKNAAGSGLSEGADTLAKFYLELAKQTGPVIEVKPGKEITAVISEGIELEIKEL